jgi:hypothetical protein
MGISNHVTFSSIEETRMKIVLLTKNYHVHLKCFIPLFNLKSSSLQDYHANQADGMGVCPHSYVSDRASKPFLGMMQ